MELVERKGNMQVTCFRPKHSSIPGSECYIMETRPIQRQTLEPPELIHHLVSVTNWHMQRAPALLADVLERYDTLLLDIGSPVT